MGLDMFLHKRRYIGNKWKDAKKQVKIDIEGVRQERVSEVVEEVGYWRKANAIHKWFVDNVQDGVDDCREYYVSRKKLQELLITVSEVLDNTTLKKGKIINGYSYKDGKKVPIVEAGKVIVDPTFAERFLPTTEGFFFGSTAYDQYYYDDLVLTKKIITEALAEEGDDFYYQSSW